MIGDDPNAKYLVEWGTGRFDPKEERRRAPRLAFLARKRLAKALGVDENQVPGAGRELYLIQFEEDPDARQAERIREQYRLKLTFGLNAITFLERLERRSVRGLRRDSLVRACVPFWPELAPRPTLDATTEAIELCLGMLDGLELSLLPEALTRLNISTLQILDDRDRGGRAMVIVSGAAGIDLDLLASFPDVVTIAHHGRKRAKNLDAAGVTQSNDPALHPIWDKGLQGQGMIVNVIDFRLPDLQHKFFSDGAAVGPNHRKVVQLRHPIGKTKVGNHATAVAGSAVGDEENHSGLNPNRGGAWAARMAYGTVDMFEGSKPPFPSTLLGELTHAATANAYIHSNSWGFNYDNIPVPYDHLANVVDAFLWEREDHLVVVAAPNYGDDYEGALVVAKNPLCVSASRAAPAQDDYDGGHAPLTTDSRRKPDILTVGENIKTSWKSRSGNRLRFKTKTGTSLATPHVAAAAALVRQYFMEGWYPFGFSLPQYAATPSGSLIKAMLLNATVDLAGEPGYPGVKEGWGRLKLDEALPLWDTNTNSPNNVLLRVWDVRHRLGLTGGPTGTKQARRFRFEVPSNASFLKVTLAFNDPAGPVSALNPVVNMLDIEVREPRPSGHGHYGNDFQSGVSLRTDMASTPIPPDPTELKNNVRQVVVQNPQHGEWTITVKAHRVDQARTPVLASMKKSHQGYALVARMTLN